VALRRGFVCLDDVPRGEVAAPHIEHFALRHEEVHGLPDLVPGCVAGTCARPRDYADRFVVARELVDAHGLMAV
jgi:hypothetical protein